MLNKKITIEDVKKFAELSRIKITDNEAKKFSKDFEEIIPFIGQISGVETGDVIARDFKNLNTLRNDIVVDTKKQKQIINEMPDTQNNYLKVKKILSN